MTAVAVARSFVNDAMSKIVSSVIGSAGAGEPSSPGSPASLREPNAWWKTTLPPWPITTTAPGSLCAAIASLISWETAAKSGVGAEAGGNAGAAGACVGATGACDVATGACDGCELSLRSARCAEPLEHAVASTSKTAMAPRADGLTNIKLAYLLQNL